MKHTLRILALLAAAAAPASAQWDPSAGQWGKQDARHVRVMTWNVKDNLRSGAIKTEAINAWTALATVVASLKPDVLVLQETADNGCSGCLDSVSDMETVLDLFLHGGTDPFLGGAVTAYVQKYAPAFDLPHVFVSSDSDGFNRNAILSRYPFQDLNGDGRSEYSDAFPSFADAYAPGTLSDPIIRGLQFVELDLPDAGYAGDLVVMNCHLKAGSDSNSMDQRLEAGKNIAYLIDYWYNGAGSGVPDPSGVIFDSPAATQILDSDTPVVIGGDWNEDESSNGRKGPAEWITRAQLTGGVDGTDRDRSDALFDGAANACDPSDTSTIGSSSKFDYFGWQDSIATLELEFIFNAASIAGGCAGGFPAELNNFPGSPALATSFASDHRPVIVDLSLPCVEASAVVRTQSPNVSSYSASPAALGGNWSLTVDLGGTTGHSNAQVFLRAQPAAVPLSQGDVLLIGGPQYFATPLLSGPLASFSAPVPNDPALCGLPAATQAVHIGGVVPFRLSNAVDLIVGE